jgi:hypothetical protein
MNINSIVNNSKMSTFRAKIILWGFGDPNASLDDVGSKIKPNHAVTAHLTEKISLKELDTKLKNKGWSMHQTSFSPSFNSEAKHHWSMTKILDDKGKVVTMRSAINADPPWDS